MLTRSAMARLAADAELDQVLLVERSARVVDAHGERAFQVVAAEIAWLSQISELA